MERVRFGLRCIILALSLLPARGLAQQPFAPQDQIPAWSCEDQRGLTEQSHIMAVREVQMLRQVRDRLEAELNQLQRELAKRDQEINRLRGEAERERAEKPSAPGGAGD